jgi:hypothetical protein
MGLDIFILNCFGNTKNNMNDINNRKHGNKIHKQKKSEPEKG